MRIYAVHLDTAKERVLDKTHFIKIIYFHNCTIYRKAVLKIQTDGIL